MNKEQTRAYWKEYAKTHRRQLTQYHNEYTRRRTKELKRLRAENEKMRRLLMSEGHAI